MGNLVKGFLKIEIYKVSRFTFIYMPVSILKHSKRAETRFTFIYLLKVYSAHLTIK